MYRTAAGGIYNKMDRIAAGGIYQKMDRTAAGGIYQNTSWCSLCLIVPLL